MVKTSRTIEALFMIKTLCLWLSVRATKDSHTYCAKCKWECINTSWIQPYYFCYRWVKCHWGPSTFWCWLVLSYWLWRFAYLISKFNFNGQEQRGQDHFNIQCAILSIKRKTNVVQCSRENLRGFGMSICTYQLYKCYIWFKNL